MGRGASEADDGGGLSIEKQSFGAAFVLKVVWLNERCPLHIGFLLVVMDWLKCWAIAVFGGRAHLTSIGNEQTVSNHCIAMLLLTRIQPLGYGKLS